VAESGLEGYGEEAAVAEGSFGIAGGGRWTKGSIGFSSKGKEHAHTFVHPSMMIV
jgi:hypothetical protein